MTPGDSTRLRAGTSFTNRPRPQSLFVRVLALAGLIVFNVAIGAGEPTLAVAINARVYNGYKRTRLADGSFKPEHYGVAEGMQWKGVTADGSIDRVPFSEVVQTIAGPLAKQGYLPSTDPKATDLLIMVFWGVTTGANEIQYDQGLSAVSGATNTALFQAMSDTASPTQGVAGWKVDLGDNALNFALSELSIANSVRDRNNRTNAGILGYSEAYAHARDMRDLGSAAGDDAINELEASRYFVVLKAYDFPFALREKKLRLLWESRFSIYAEGNRFDKQLPVMTQVAAHFFGQETRGLVHQDSPEGSVEVGPLRVVEPPTAPRKK